MISISHSVPNRGRIASGSLRRGIGAAPLIASRSPRTRARPSTPPMPATSEVAAEP
ncbi:Uncharacterised protein [Mycobacteroides abscessus subsp. abscessus]|nr:Uncharacterised protein [Mycobacteroides abscessus subsp. abscessus]